MKVLNTLVVLLGMVLVLSAEGVKAQCDRQFVNETGGTLLVLPTGNDDTANIQCALEEARDRGFSTVKLDRGDYYISRLQIEGFSGTFEGTTRDSSRLFVFNGGVDCSAQENAGQSGAGIKFIEGEPRVRFMSIIAETPCQEGPSDYRFQMLHFTGQPSGTGCDFDVIFGEVDRVDFFGPGRLSSRLIGVGANPEGGPLNTCKDRLLGTMKVNQSTFTGVSAGVVAAMKANAQFDVRFNEFSDYLTAVLVAEASQDLAIAQNEFIATDSSQAGTQSISAGTTAGSPNSNRIVIHGNDFVFSNAVNQGSTSIAVIESDKDINMSLMVTENHFDSSGAEGVPLTGIDVSNGQVSSNRFTGSGFAAVMVGTKNRRVSGWSINANNFNQFSAQNSGQFDMVFFQNTVDNIFGPAQGARISDSGNNYILGATPVNTRNKAAGVNREAVHRTHSEHISQFVQ